MALLGAPQEVPKKRAKTFPLGTPSVRAKTEARAPLYFCEGEQIQLLRSHFDIKMRTRKTHVPRESKNFCPLLCTRFRTDFNPKRESKNPCQQQPHLGRAIYAPKMEDACQKQNPRRSSSERREVGGSKGESLGSFSFALSLWNDKERASKAIRSARDARRAV